MDVREAQKQVRTVYLGGLIGQLLSLAAAWSTGALLATFAVLGFTAVSKETARERATT